MEKLFQDLHFALRVYAKNRSFTIVAVLALAIGIGSNIAVFTVVNAMLFRSLPYPDGDRLVQVGRSLNAGPVYPMSYARFRFLEQNNRAAVLMAAYGLRLLVPGVVVGVMLSIALRSVVPSFLFGVSSAYLVVYVAVILLLSLIATIATLGPAIRATRVDLTTLLRQ